MRNSSRFSSLLFILGSVVVLASTVTKAAVTVSPARAAVVISTQTQQFTASVNGATWSVDNIVGGNSTVGTITATGLYTPPAKAGIHTITATSAGTSGSATIYITDLKGIFTYHNDNSRDGINTREFALSSSTVATSSFGKLFSCAVDGAVYAQPLWIRGVSIAGGTHNVIVVATQHDSVYVFDADSKPCVTYWHAPIEPAPAEMLSAVNLSLAERRIEAQFVSIIYAVWDDAQRTLTVSNSGLPRPIYCHGGKNEVIEATGLPLGLFDEADYDEFHFRMKPGDMFVFFSDGILDARNRKGELFGRGRVEKIVAECSASSAASVVESLFKAVAEHSAGVETFDDQTVVAIRVQGSAHSSARKK